jgi:flagellar hook-basal body complex protein FliE
MNEISPEQLLSQIRALGRELQTTDPQAPASTGFGEMLKSSIDAVNEAQQQASELRVGFETGSGDATLAEVMIAAQKANLAFRAVAEVRNKLITAYQDIMNMPV